MYYLIKCSHRSLEVKLSPFLGNYDRQTNQQTSRRTKNQTDRVIGKFHYPKQLTSRQRLIKPKKPQNNRTLFAGTMSMIGEKVVLTDDAMAHPWEVEAVIDLGFYICNSNSSINSCSNIRSNSCGNISINSSSSSCSNNSNNS